MVHSRSKNFERLGMDRDTHSLLTTSAFKTETNINRRIFSLRSYIGTDDSVLNIPSSGRGLFASMTYIKLKTQ